MVRNCGAVKVVERVEFTERESVKIWLEKQGQQTQVWFALRFAFRAVPFLDGLPSAFEPIDTLDDTSAKIVLTIFRALLIASVEAQPTINIGNIHRSIIQTTAESASNTAQFCLNERPVWAFWALAAASTAAIATSEKQNLPTVSSTIGTDPVSLALFTPLIVGITRTIKKHTNFSVH